MDRVLHVIKKMDRRWSRDIYNEHVQKYRSK